MMSRSNTPINSNETEKSSDSIYVQADSNLSCLQNGLVHHYHLDEFIHGGESRDILHLYSDRMGRNIHQKRRHFIT